jgi:hypothetical protein
MAIGKFFENDSFDFDFKLTMGNAPYRCAEVGECLATAARIRDGDIDGWFDEWMATAGRLRAIAEQAEAKGHRASARDAWLRASKYVATAFFYVLGTRDPSRSLATWEAHRAAFDRAIALWPTPAAKVAIPYEGTTLEGYWLAPGSGGRRPLAILNNGSDGTAVDMIAMGAADALERGWHALILDGPGQGAALYRQHLPFRYDWEKVITPVVDFALARDDVDPAGIALLGVSQAGYWVPRAAAFEHRLAAAVADPGVMRVWSSWFDNLPKEELALFDKGDRQGIDAGVAAALPQLPPAVRFNLAKRREPYLTDSFFDLLTEVRRYDLTGVAGLVRCPTLVADPEGEQFWPGQSRELYDALTCPKALVAFTAAEGADGHCEPLAPTLRNQRVFDWLDETLGRA